MNDREAKRAKELSREVIVNCSCGNNVVVSRGAKAFYCPGCGSSKLVGSELGIVIPNSDFKK